MKVLVTGANGFVDRVVCRNLATTGITGGITGGVAGEINVVAVTRKSENIDGAADFGGGVAEEMFGWYLEGAYHFLPDEWKKGKL